MDKTQPEVGELAVNPPRFTVLKYDRDRLIDYHKTKCFYVYTEEDTCFDCGVAKKNIFGYYRGEPDEEAMMKIAKQIYKDMDPEEFEKQVKVYKYTIVYDNGWSKTVHEAEEFELEDVD